MYNNDLAIVAEDEDSLQSIFKKLEKRSLRNSMVVSTEKTKVMSFRRGGKRRKGATSWKFWGNTTVKAGALYGVEIWGWQRREIIEGVQLRFVKTCLGFPKYTIDYVCKMEEGRREIEVDALRRAVGFL